VLDAVKAAKLKTLRIFISQTPQNNKNTGSVAMPDIEPSQVGKYDDTQLKAIDQLMVEARERGEFPSRSVTFLVLMAAGIKLIIAMHDRYQLGCWGNGNNSPLRSSSSPNNMNNRYICFKVQAPRYRLREDASSSERRHMVLPRPIANLRLRQSPHSYPSAQESATLERSTMERPIRLHLCL
jgi:hypothetical protein